MYFALEELVETKASTTNATAPQRIAGSVTDSIALSATSQSNVSRSSSGSSTHLVTRKISTLDDNQIAPVLLRRDTEADIGLYEILTR
jgi:hypothetical protein